MTDVFRQIEFTRVGLGGTEVTPDSAATEEPMQVRLDGEPFAVIMRMPGSDQELAAAFLFSKRVIRSAEARRPRSLVVIGPARQRPDLVRNPPEGVSCRHPDCGGGLCAVIPCRGARRSGGPDASRLRARRNAERLFPCGTHTLRRPMRWL